VPSSESYLHINRPLGNPLVVVAVAVVGVISAHFLVALALALLSLFFACHPFLPLLSVVPLSSVPPFCVGGVLVSPMSSPPLPCSVPLSPPPFPPPSESFEVLCAPAGSPSPPLADLPKWAGSGRVHLVMVHIPSAAWPLVSPGGR